MKFKDIPTLYLDTGHAFSDETREPDKLGQDTIVKDDWILQGYSEMGYDVINLTARDLPYVAHYVLPPDEHSQKVQRLSIVGGLISANIIPAKGSNLTPPKPYVIREVRGKRIPDRPGLGPLLRVGIIGLTDRAPLNGLGLVIEDPFKAAVKIVPEVAKQADMVVVLAFLPMAYVYRLAAVVKGIDLVIGNTEGPYIPDVKRDGKTFVAFSSPQTKSLGEVRVYLNQDGTIRDYANRYTSLDHVIHDDPAAARIVADAHAAFTEAQKKESFTLAAAVPKGSSNYVTAQSCAECHQREYEIWAKSGHARAMATLEKRNQQFDTKCIRCHSTGMGDGGFAGIAQTPQFASVQCEACHSAARLHVELPAKGFGRTSVPAGCVSCHTHENSPDFDPVSYWQRIKH